MDCGNASRGIHSGTFFKVVNACTRNEQFIVVCRRVGGFVVNFVVTLRKFPQMLFVMKKLR